MIKAILFDLWNTLIYDTENKHKMLIACLREAGIDNPHDFQDRFLCSRSFKDLNEVANLISDKTGCSRQRALKIVRENASQNGVLFPDVASALGGLRKDYKLAIISNFMDFTASAVEKSGIESFFDYRFYSCRIGMIKQNPELFRHALGEMGIKPQEAVMVGDCKFADIDPAEKAGIRAVLIKREGFPLGYTEKERFKRTIKTLDELDRHLRP